MKSHHGISRRFAAMKQAVVIKTRPFKFKRRAGFASDIHREATYWGMTSEEWLSKPVFPQEI